jgi:Carbohydrate esterase, sialic acid-specific acetylesterase
LRSWVRKSRGSTGLIVTLGAVLFGVSAPGGFLLSQTGSEAPAAEPDITLTSPLDYQVFQRRSLLKGRVEVVGQIHVAADQVEARLSGMSLSGPLPDKWKRLSFDKSSGNFHSALDTTAGGFYKLQIKALRAHHPVAEITVPHVGMGEVFVISGQSNSTNYGEVPQSTQTGMVVSFNGTSWQIANDPQPGVQDNSKKGSFIPAFGDALYEKYHVPIGVASVGHGSTSVRQWLPAGEPVDVMPTMTKFVTRDANNNLVSDGTLFNGMMKRIDQLGKHGFRALLWHQGESDANQPPGHQMAASTYRRMMIKIIRQSRKGAGWKFPWLVAEATYHSPQDQGSPPIQEAQRSLWQSGIALEGPDTDTLGSQYRQNNGKGVHFNDIGLKAHGALWAEAVERYLDTVLH